MAVDLSKKARAFLQELRFAVLATIHQDGTPQLTTMWDAIPNFVEKVCWIGLPAFNYTKFGMAS